MLLWDEEKKVFSTRNTWRQKSIADQLEMIKVQNYQCYCKIYSNNTTIEIVTRSNNCQFLCCPCLQIWGRFCKAKILNNPNSAFRFSLILFVILIKNYKSSINNDFVKTQSYFINFGNVKINVHIKIHLLKSNSKGNFVIIFSVLMKSIIIMI